MNRRAFILSSAAVSAFPNSVVAANPGPKTRVALTISLRQRVADRALNTPKPFYESALTHRRTDEILFSKGLRHNRLLSCDRNLQARIFQAIDNNDIADLDRFIRSERPWVNPMGGNALLDAGRDTTQYRIPVPPNLNSAEFDWEAAEVAWASICRDVPFAHYGEEELTAKAFATLYRAQGSTDQIRNHLFQPNNRPPLKGAIISAFLLRPGHLGGVPQSWTGLFTSPGSDCMTEFEEFLKIQDGGWPAAQPDRDNSIHLPTTGRHIANLVHRDFPAQYFMSAAQTLFDLGPSAYHEMHPYSARKHQTGFVSFGLPHCYALLNRVASQALQVAWYLKWNVFCRIRPEEYFGLRTVGIQVTGPRATSPGLSSTMKVLHDRAGIYLLPQVYPEGSPIHPAFPAGHAVAAGACGTILKCIFRGDAEFPTQPNSHKLDASYSTIGEEIDKLIWNVSFGRVFAGIHWRSDCEAGISLGEQVANDLLRDSMLFQAEPTANTRYLNFQRQEVTI